MKISCGTDIIEIDRIKESITRLSDRFINTVFTENEIKYCEQHKENKYQHYAARFAAKEALYKALSEIIEDKNWNWKKFEVINDKNGKPYVEIHNEKIISIDISISHCKTYAVAYVVVLYE